MYIPLDLIAHQHQTVLAEVRTYVRTSAYTYTHSTYVCIYICTSHCNTYMYIVGSGSSLQGWPLNGSHLILSTPLYRVSFLLSATWKITTRSAKRPCLWSCSNLRLNTSLASVVCSSRTTATSSWWGWVGVDGRAAPNWQHPWQTMNSFRLR